MYKVRFTKAFKKSYKLMEKRGFDIKLLDEVIEQLMQGNELDPKYRNHTLIGNYKGFSECHIQSDWILIYLIEEDLLILTCVDTGTHSDIFKK